MMLARPAAALGAAFALALAAGAVSAPAAKAGEVLSFTTSATPTAPQSPVFEAWAKMIEEKTNGDLEVEFYYQQSLSKLADNLKAVSSGLADIGILVPAYTRTVFPLTYLSSTSFGAGDPYVITQAWLATRDAFPEIAAEDEANNLKFLTNHSIGSTVLVGDQFYPTPQAMNGKTMRLSSHWTYAAKALDLDVNPARIRSPETYTSLEKGTITGSVTYLGQLYPYKLNEVADHLTILDLGQHMNMYYMNLDRWNDLTDEQREIIAGSLPQLTLDLARAEITFDEESLAKVQVDETYPMKVLKVEGADKDAWRAGLKPSYDNNVAKATEVNPDAPRIAEFYIGKVDALEEKMKAESYPW